MEPKVSLASLKQPTGSDKSKLKYYIFREPYARRKSLRLLFDRKLRRFQSRSESGS